MGGAQIFCYNLVKKLLENNHDVDLYLPRNAVSSFIDLNITSDLKVKPIWRNEQFISRHMSWLISKKLINIQNKNNYDLWQVIGAYPAGWVAKKLAKQVPVVLRCHGDDIQKDEEIGYGSRLNRKIEKKIEKTLDVSTHLIALTKTVEDCFSQLGNYKDKITRIPNGIELNRFNNQSKFLKRKYKFNEETKVLLTIGRYHKKKGYENIPLMAKYLINNGLNIKWFIIGKDLNILNISLLDLPLFIGGELG